MAWPVRGKIDPAVLAGWKATQADLRARRVVAPIDPLPRFVAGADCAYSSDGAEVFAAAVVYDREQERIVEVAGERRAVEAPYIPTYLSFREAPAVTAAIGKLRHAFGAVLFDGQGVAHPRRCGLAVHVGVTLDVPSVGVAKSRLIGTHDEPGDARSDAAELTHDGEAVGVVLRTRPGVRPLYVSVGHRADVPTATALVLACLTKYRLPEPTRQADIEVARMKG